MHNKILNEFSGDKIGDFIVENDVVSIIKEGADTGRAPVDDGPGTFYKSLDQYKRETKDWVKQLQNDLGYKVIGYILSDGAMDPEEDYTMDYRDVPAISYGAKKKYKSRLRDVIENLGWRVIKWMGVDDPNVLFAGPPVASGIDAAGRMEDNIRNTSDFSKKAPKTSGGQPRLHVENLTPEWWKNELLLEGDLYIDEEKGLVMCAECGDWMKQIQYRHLKYKHNLTMKEYRNKYPNVPLLSESSKNTKDSGKNSMSDSNVRKKHLDSVNTKEYKELQSQLSTGRIPTDETRQLMSENNAMKDEKNRKKVSVGVKKSYENEELIETRRKQFTEIRNSDKYNERMYELGLWTRPEDKDVLQLYTENVRKLTNDNYQKHFYDIPNAKKRSRKWHLDHKVSINYGFKNDIPIEIIAHYKNLEVILHSLNESKSTKNSILFEDLLKDIEHSNNPLDNRILLMCGGAAGHLNHPFDDKDLTFKDLKNIIEMGLDGNLDREDNVTEKLDGQNLMVSWKS
ncbi:MucR family transcriptional regulator [bacterium]|nr:MucR family transcriptional regulator [bacterium]